MRNGLMGIVLILLGAVGAYNLTRSSQTDVTTVPQAQANLDAVPMVVGSWQGRELPSDPKVMRVAQALAFSNREYRHAQNRGTVRVLTMYGPSGDQGAHDPEVCYSGLGFKRLEEPVRRNYTAAETDAPVHLWNARFLRSEPQPPTELLLAWGWRDRTGWVAPSQPRLAFAGQNMIYKIYIQIDSGDTADAKSKRLDDFAKPYFQELNRTLTTPSR